MRSTSGIASSHLPWLTSIETCLSAAPMRCRSFSGSSRQTAGIPRASRRPRPPSNAPASRLYPARFSLRARLASKLVTQREGAEQGQGNKTAHAKWFLVEIEIGAFKVADAALQSIHELVARRNANEIEIEAELAHAKHDVRRDSPVERARRQECRREQHRIHAVPGRRGFGLCRSSRARHARLRAASTLRELRGLPLRRGCRLASPTCSRPTRQLSGLFSAARTRTAMASGLSAPSSISRSGAQCKRCSAPSRGDLQERRGRSVLPHRTSRASPARARLT